MMNIGSMESSAVGRTDAEHALTLHTWSEHPEGGSEPVVVVSAVSGCGGLAEEREPRGASWAGAYEEAKHRLMKTYAAHVSKARAMPAASGLINRTTPSGASDSRIKINGVYGPASGSWRRGGHVYAFDASARAPFNRDPRALMVDPDPLGECVCEPGGLTICEACLELTSEPVGVGDPRAPGVHVLCPGCRGELRQLVTIGGGSFGETRPCTNCRGEMPRGSHSIEECAAVLGPDSKAAQALDGIGASRARGRPSRGSRWHGSQRRRATWPATKSRS